MGIFLCKYIIQVRNKIFTDLLNFIDKREFLPSRNSESYWKKNICRSHSYSMLSVVTELVHTPRRTYIKDLY